MQIYLTCKEEGYLAFGYKNSTQSPERLELEMLSNKLPEGQISLLNDIVRAMLAHNNRI